MKPQLYLLPFGLLLFGGCNKDKEEQAVPLLLAGEYQSTNTLVATPIAMYTKQGEVRNAALIDGFIRRRIGPTSTYFSRTDVAINDGSKLTLTIDANDQVTQVTTSPSGSTTTLKGTVTLRTPQYFGLATTDSTTLLSGIGSNGCDQFIESIRAITPGKKCRALPPATGYSQRCSVQLVEAISTHDGQLFLPALAWLVSRKSSFGSCSLTYSGERNLFNPAAINQLTTGDTLVVQVREIPLTRK